MKRSRPESVDLRSSAGDVSSHAKAPESPQKLSKKIKLHDSYATQSPFPEFPRPTPEEALEVYNLLRQAHPEFNVTRRRHAGSGVEEGTKERNRSDEEEDDGGGANSAKTCGDVANVIESLIGTILSQNTSGKNSSAAKDALDRAFGRNNFEAMVSGPVDRVADAIRCGGLANKKAKTIQNVLRTIKQKHGDYSLQHLAHSSLLGSRAEEDEGGSGLERKPMTDDEVMKELMSYDGVGPKTASCVLLFCLGRDSFAVDTHVFRLSKVLGWVPNSADRVLAQAHLDLRIPAELKHGLHVLMVYHGRACKGCKTPSSSSPCVLKSYASKRRKAAHS